MVLLATRGIFVYQILGILINSYGKLLPLWCILLYIVTLRDKIPMLGEALLYKAVLCSAPATHH
jgi:hypothetical protein